MSLSPTQRTLRALREQGRIAAIVEKWNAHAGPFGIRQDLFGIVDVLALDPVRGFVGVQSCGQAFAAHYRKLTEEKAQESLDWMRTPGGVLELWSWRKVKAKRGGKALVWRARVHTFTVEDITDRKDGPEMGGVMVRDDGGEP